MNWTMTLALTCLCVAITSPATAFADRYYHTRSFHPPGHHIRALPPSHTRISVRGKRYHYDRGEYYRTDRGTSGYVVVHAPIGARVNSLPPGYISFGVGPHRYHYVNLLYSKLFGKPRG